MIKHPLCLSCKKYIGLRDRTPKCKAYYQGVPREIIFEEGSCISYKEKVDEEGNMNDEKKPGKQEQKERLIELRASGMSFAAISHELGVSKPTLISWSKDLAFDIQNARGLRLDELSQHFAVAKEKRIEAFGKRLETILAELDKRDLSSIPTDKLLMIALRYGEMLRTESVPLTLAEKQFGPHLEILDEEVKKWSA